MGAMVFSQVLVLVFLIFLGFISIKFGIIPKEASAFFSSFVLKITVPCLIIYSFHRPFSQELLGEAALILGGSALVYALSLLLGWVYPLLLRINGPERGVHRATIVISNAGFFGYPVVESLMGPAYMFHAVIFNVLSVVMAFSVAVWLVAKEGDKAPVISWRLFVNPPIVATFIGFFIFLFSVSLPWPLDEGLRLAGGMTTPLSMVVIGISIAQMNFKQTFGRWRIYVTVFMRLVFIPAMIGFVCYTIGLRGHILMILVLLSGMPAGSTIAILGSVYNVAPEEASSLVGISTVLSAVTIPLLVIVIQQFLV